MNSTTTLLTNFIHNNSIVSTCDFISERINVGRIIYEVVRVIDGKPLFYREHADRFYNSLLGTGLEISLSKRSLALRVKALIEANKLADGNIRFQLSFTEGSQPVFTAWVTPFFYPAKELYKIGVCLSKMEAERKIPNVKAYNPKLVEDVSSVIFNSSNYEVLFVNAEGFITEGSRSNIFFVKGNTILTSPSIFVLPGITRQKIIEIAKNNDISCNEINIESNSISSFDGVFITGTSPKVLPVNAIDETYFNPNNTTIRKVMDEYDVIMTEDVENFSWSHLIGNQ